VGRQPVAVVSAAEATSIMDRHRAAPATQITPPMLSVRGLQTVFTSGKRRVRAVDDVSFDIRRGEAVGLVGESGSGKTVTARSIVRLISPPGRIEGGSVLLEGVDLLQQSEGQLRRVRGRQIGFVFQDPMASLNPTLRVGYQISEVVRTHLAANRSDARARAIELLELVHIPNARHRVDDYPHQFSGGMRQRVMIAIALACDPVLLIADEPTTALDVTVQAQILELLRGMAESRGMGLLLITHDLGVASQVCDRILVMYAGQVVESGNAHDLLASPSMPYTTGLVGCRPTLADDPNARFVPIEGTTPDLAVLPPGCRFAPRCPHQQPVCRAREPLLVSRPGRQRLARCWATEEGGWLR
jgi:oligopeptide/dipeptide ABC transporter ATP-binding protein